MVNFIKRPAGASKGILVFTHKEREILCCENSALDRLLSRLAEKYVFGMHWGGYVPNIRNVPHIRFHLGGKWVAPLLPKTSPPLIPLCSRNFISDDFCPSDSKKYWDVIAVGRCVPEKRHEDYLHTLRYLFDVRPKSRAALIAPIDASDVAYANSLSSLLNELFNADEQRRIDIIMPYNIPVHKLLAISQETIARLMQMSRVFVHTSLAEGNVRVVHEALLCGLPCVMPREVDGGGHDYLNESNSRLFDTLSEAGAQLVALLENPPDMEAEARRLSEDLWASRSLLRLEEELKKLFADFGEVYEGYLEPGNYSQVLSSHTQRLPREWVEHPNQDDLISPEAAARFAAGLTGETLNGADIASLRRTGKIMKLRRVGSRITRGLRRRLEPSASVAGAR
jgi:glycosyltransferase involved in cell wall biosynthesis